MSNVPCEHVMSGNIRIRISHRRTSLIKWHLTGMTYRKTMSLTLSYIIKPCSSEPDPTKSFTQKTDTPRVRAQIMKYPNMTTRATCYQRNKPVLAAQSYNTPAMRQILRQSIASN